MQEQNCEVFTTIVVRRPEYNTLIQTQVHTGCHVSPQAKLIKHKRFSPSKTTTRLFLFEKRLSVFHQGETTSRKVLSRSSGGTCRSARRRTLQLAANGTSANTVGHKVRNIIHPYMAVNYNEHHNVLP
jgi:hypothetical protein